MGFRQKCLVNFSIHLTTQKGLGMHLLGLSLYNLRTCIKKELKRNLTPPYIAGYLGNKNSPWSLLFGYSILRHKVTIRVDVDFKPKNPAEVLHFQKIQVLVNVSRIWTQKISERGICRKQLVLDQKKRDMQPPHGSTNLVCLRRPGMRSPQHANP